MDDVALQVPVHVPITLGPGLVVLGNQFKTGHKSLQGTSLQDYPACYVKGFW
jgi:hypothetical protein